MIYILEDDDSIRKLVIYALESQGMAAEGFETPERFRAALAAKKPELVLLDIMLPHEDGISVLRSMRKYPETAEIPVIMLTAKNTEFDRVTGLDAGADDYIAKPFGMMELVARIRAVLRRTKPKPAITEYRRGTLYVCPEKHIVQADGREIQLTNKEFMLLCTLLEHMGLVMTRETLLERVWGLYAEPENRTLDVHIRSLRAKLGAAGSCIETVRGIGYRISGEET
ncbi:MAG: response regulator transcription factor [Oscillospiraceae bacterium]|nr:response regulator transcription factor [Oscillospiraceae bacterium]